MRAASAATRPAQLLEELDLALQDPLVGAQDFLFVLLQRRRDEALAAGDGLLAVIVRRHRVQVRFRDLDVVAEDAVVADLQRRDAGARALALFQLRDDLLAGAADAAQVVQLGVDAVADVAAVADQGAGLLDDVRLDGVTHVRQVVERADERANQRRVARVQRQANARHGGDRLLQADEIARPGGAERRARHEALEVVHRFQQLAELAAVGAAKGQLFDRVEPIVNAIERHERPQQPRAEHASAHRRDRAVDLVQQRSVASALHRFDDFQVPERDGVDQEAVGGRLERNRADVREVRFLRVAQVVEQRAGGGHRGAMAVEAEPFKAGGVQLFEQASARRFMLERPGLHARDLQAGRHGIAEHRREVEVDGATTSRGRSTLISSARACTPAAPEYSAHENSPVERSNSATPHWGSLRWPASGFGLRASG